ncbi:Chromate resistance protein ChrB [Sphaerimonospora cavernae]|uniref:Chromate resistance protein ChrB n=1 Tax=Sphaerimonospora cavernae TaxID=1740611 RepID=A0ABV6TXH5_9ACTN
MSDVMWMVLIYRVPSEPTRLRATVWRRLKRLGAVYLQNSAAALPHSPGTERAPSRQAEAAAALERCGEALEGFAARVYGEDSYGG